MGTQDQHTTSKAQHDEHVGTMPEEVTTDERESTTAQESAAASGNGAASEASAEQSRQKPGMEGCSAWIRIMTGCAVPQNRDQGTSRSQRRPPSAA